MKNKISFIRVETMSNHEISVTFFPRGGRRRVYHLPSNDSLYRLLNNSMVFDICAYNEPYGLALEVTPKYH